MPRFAEMMNKKAAELGLENTHFVTPHGLDMPEHYTTAYELALLSSYALDNKTFAEIVKTSTYTVHMNGYPKEIRNTNELLGHLNGVTGVKTGFTNGANRCIVTSVERDDMNIITVVLGADTKKDRTADSVKLIEYTYKNYKNIPIREMVSSEFENWKKINQNRIQINKGTKPYIDMELANLKKEYITIKNTEEKDVSIHINYTHYFEAPVKKGQIIGKLAVNIDEREILILDIVAKEEIKKKTVWNYLIELLGISIFR